jgi:FKBP-type peptidyl-prolyl cis-trans isomerase FkpA
MRILNLFVLVAAVLMSAACGADVDPKTEDEKALYAIGLAISRNLSSFNLNEKDLEVVKAGLSDGVLNKQPKVELEVYGPKIQELQQSRMAGLAEKGKQAGKEFAEKAATEKGATKTESGLVYTPMSEGKGASPKATDTVKVHYEGKLVDGKVFDSSLQRGEPVQFPLNQVIPCWTEGVQKMKVGEKAQLVCPSNIAYGDSGRPPTIPPGATLVFQVELLDIVSSNAKAAPKAPAKPAPKAAPKPAPK